MRARLLINNSLIIIIIIIIIDLYLTRRLVMVVCKSGWLAFLLIYLKIAFPFWGFLGRGDERT
jgi:hypothetical protein